MEKNLDIFDYKNVIDILIGMSAEQKKTLAEKMVERFPSTTYDLASEFMIQLQDREAEEGILSWSLYRIADNEYGVCRKHLLELDTTS